MKKKADTLESKTLTSLKIEISNLCMIRRMMIQQKNSFFKQADSILTTMGINTKQVASTGDLQKLLDTTPTKETEGMINNQLKFFTTMTASIDSTIQKVETIMAERWKRDI